MIFIDPKAIVKALVDATKKRLNKQWMAIRDEPCDEVDRADLYLEFFKENSGDIRMVHRHDRKFGDDLLHAAGLALLIKNEYADTYLDEREPEPSVNVDVRNTSDDIHDTRLVSHYIVRDRNYIHKED